MDEALSKCAGYHIRFKGDRRQVVNAILPIIGAQQNRQALNLAGFFDVSSISSVFTAVRLLPVFPRFLSFLPLRYVKNVLGEACRTVGTIIARKRKDNTMGYSAQIVIKRKGHIIYRETQTFDRRQAASAWLARRESELAQPGALDRKDDPPLSEVIDRYIQESKKKIGRTKSQVLSTIKPLLDWAEHAGVIANDKHLRSLSLAYGDIGGPCRLIVEAV